MGAQMHRLIEVVLLSTHNVCFGQEIRKLIFWYASKVLFFNVLILVFSFTLSQKESLSKELEHEKMLRVNAEQRLHEMTRETDGCRSRLHSLQDEFKK